MKKKRMKKNAVIACVAAATVLGSVLPGVYAAVTVDSQKLEYAVEINSLSSNFSELPSLPVTVNLYKVAEIDKEGKCVAVDVLNKVDYSGLSSETTASELETISALTKKAIEEVGMDVTANVQTSQGVASVSDLMTGLYLVDAQTAESDYYQYEFTPYLVAFEKASETYTINLKSSKTDRYGDLVIEKLLDTYNETLGGANFVFQVEASKTDVDTQETRVVYSNVVSMTFHNPGTDRIIIEDIPAGADVTVTEIYSGASYTLTSDDSVNVTIIADGEEGQATAQFANTFDERLNGGTGLVNNFTYNSETGEWTYQATEDSTQ